MRSNDLAMCSLADEKYKRAQKDAPIGTVPFEKIT